MLKQELIQEKSKQPPWCIMQLHILNPPHPHPPPHTCFCSFWSNWKPLNTFHLKIIRMPHSAKPSDPLWIPGGALCLIQFTHLWQYESPCLLATEIINPTKAFFPSTKSSSLFLPFLSFFFFFLNVRLHPIQHI